MAKSKNQNVFTEAATVQVAELISIEIMRALQRFPVLDFGRIEGDARRAIQNFTLDGKLEQLGYRLRGCLRGIFLIQFAFARTRPAWFAEMFADELKKEGLVLEHDLQRRFEKHLDRYRAHVACGVDFDLDEAAALHAQTFEIMSALVEDQKRIDAKRAERAEAERKEREAKEAKERAEAEVARKREKRNALASSLLQTLSASREPREILGNQGTEVVH